MKDQSMLSYRHLGVLLSILDEKLNHFQYLVKISAHGDLSGGKLTMQFQESIDDIRHIMSAHVAMIPDEKVPVFVEWHPHLGRLFSMKPSPTVELPVYVNMITELELLLSKYDNFDWTERFSYIARNSADPSFKNMLLKFVHDFDEELKKLEEDKFHIELQRICVDYSLTSD